MTAEWFLRDTPASDLDELSFSIDLTDVARVGFSVAESSVGLVRDNSEAGGGGGLSWTAAVAIGPAGRLVLRLRPALLPLLVAAVVLETPLDGLRGWRVV